MGGRGGSPAETLTPTAGAPVGTAVETVLRAFAAATVPSQEGRTAGLSPLVIPGNTKFVADIRDAMAAMGIRDRADQDAALQAADRSHRVMIYTGMQKSHMSRREIDGGLNMGGDNAVWITTDV
jgi:hypothetical protein